MSDEKKPEETVFEKLSKINCNMFTKKKGQFTYLSWCYAWEQLMRIAPDAEKKVYEDPNTGLPYFTSSAGVLVKVGVIVNGVERVSRLAVMDFKNNAKKVEQTSMRDVMDTIQRCLVKAIALHGLGLYIYAGEDLPKDSQPKPPPAPSKKPDPNAPTQEQRREYFDLLNEFYNGVIPKAEIDDAKQMSMKDMVEAIQELRDTKSNAQQTNA